MSIIPCALGCIHQSDGYCGLETTAAVSNVKGGCPHFQKKQVKKSVTSAVNQTYPK